MWLLQSASEPPAESPEADDLGPENPFAPDLGKVEKPFRDDWYSPRQLGIARIGLALLVLGYLALWPSEPVMDDQGTRAWLELPRLGRGLLRLAAFGVGAALFAGWWVRLVAPLGALLSVIFAMNGRADPAIAGVLAIGLVLTAIPGGDNVFGIPPFTRSGSGLQAPPMWWSRGLWILISLPALILPWMYPAWLDHPGASVPSVLLLGALVLYAVFGPAPRVAAAFYLIWGLVMFVIAGPVSLPLWAWATFFCLNSFALPPRAPPPASEQDDPTQLDETPPLIVFYDGVCGLCQSSVQLIVSEDRRSLFKLSPLQGETAKRLLGKHLSAAALQDPDSLVLYEAGQIYERSTGALRIASHLGGIWRMISWARVLPEGVRDAAYDLVAENRYAWFGKLEVCRIPTPEERERFLD